MSRSQGLGRLCEVYACGKPHVARGWCSAHWSRWKRTGDPLTEPSRIVGDDRARFTSKWIVGPVPGHRLDLGPCHLWTGTATDRGYGEFGIAGRIIAAHRVAYEWEHGPIPPGLVIDHLCRGDALRPRVSPRSRYPRRERPPRPARATT